MRCHKGAWLPLLIAAAASFLEVHGQWVSQSCGRDDFVCSNNKCIESSKRCDRVFDCPDREDEFDCECTSSDFRCVDDGSCIEGRRRCDGTANCRDGSDEIGCGSCPADLYTCPSNSRVRCATRCDDNKECDNGEDEEDCSLDEDCHECDGRCLKYSLVCDGKPDCSDGSDEASCEQCDRPDDFRCDDGDCIKLSQRCNGIAECDDDSDERHCNETIPATREGCLDGQFRCRDGTCLNNEFLCDGNSDCYDGSDEISCKTYVSGSGGSRRFYSPYAPRTERPQTRRYDPYATERPSDPYDPNRAEPRYPYDANQPGSNNPYGSNQPGSNNPYDSNQPGSNNPPGSNQPGSYNPYGSNQPDSNNPSGSNQPGAENPYGSNQPGSYNPYGSNQPDSNNPSGSNQPGAENPYGSNQPGSYNPYGSNQPDSNNPSGSNQPGAENPYGSNQPGSNNPYGSNQPGSNNPSGSNQPGAENPYGSNQPGSNNPYGSNQPGSYNPYGSNQAGSDNPYGSNQDSSNDIYGSNQPGSDNTSGSNQGSSNDIYGSNQSGSNDPYGSNQAGSNNPYGSNQPGSDNTSGSNQGGSNDIYGSNQSGSNDPYGSNQAGSNIPYDSNQDSSNNQPNTNDIYRPSRPGSDPNQGYPDSNNQYGGGRYPGQGQSGYPGSPNGPVTLDVKTYPTDQAVRYGGDVVFQCRDEGPRRAHVRWVREGGRSLKAGSSDKDGRLELYQVTLSDSGVYICQTPDFLGQPGSEVRVTLNVNRPQRPVTTRPPFTPCGYNEATCGNGECIPKSAVCDGKMDCSDRSDEDTCNYNGRCEPNQFQCENRKCVLKSWLCDSDDDCGDGSDEKNCPSIDPSAPCLPIEFACHSNSQCVPRSFHCDGRNDCIDGSDEVGCDKIYITKPPSPANVRLNPGDTLVLTCQAIGVPEPIISWRLNWGHVPPKCTESFRAGVGNLTCVNMMPEDSGAYSCEAINNRGTVFAIPDAIVFVSQTNPCPEGYFNNEARSQSECIRCFCFGNSARCHSADLFTYNMPTPLGEGGTRLLGVALSGDGEVRTDPSIINHYYYQSMRNGATVTKLESHDDNWLGNFHPFLTLPESYNGNQLTSYGGHIKYIIKAHTNNAQSDDTPSIIVKGKYATLYHVPTNEISSSEFIVEARFVPEYWQKAGPNGYLIPATREDIMMALDAVDMILLRADNNNAGVNITDFVMESAQHMNSGLGAASLVEECTCPEGYDGLSCQKCKPGYVRENSGPFLGRCVRKSCPPGTYGDPAMGNACKPCPCPLTNKDNQFATTCSLSPSGSVVCDCFSGYEGQTCEKCAAGFEGNPLVVGDTCRVRPTHNCNAVGTRHEQVLECVCKDNVQGRYCDQCKNDSFYLSNDFRHGCALCFCSGESQQCMSSNLRRKTTSINFNVPTIVDQVKVYNTQPQGNGNFRYTAPVETSLRPLLTRGGLGLSGLDRSRPTVYYWSMPLSFAGNKVTSYGGYLRYTLDNVPSYVDSRLKNKAADVQLISDNHLTFQYFGNFQPSYEGVLNVSVQLLEKGWQRSDGKEVPREHFLLALADVKTILIKATYATDAIATPLYASIETAASDGDGPAALHVEQCVCPPGYIGTSCEDCAPGFTRGNGGLYLAHCEVCQCNGHSNNCHPETGQCYECLDNTDGPRCELCKDGYERDGYDHCVAIEGISTTTPCRCDPRGEAEACDVDGTCSCKRNVDGGNCDRCRPGTYGLNAANPDGCIPCFCSGATTECQEAMNYYRAALPAPIFGDNYGGYTIMNINADIVINDQFIPNPDKSELMYIFSNNADRDLYWSLPVFPGNRVLSYGGYLALRQEFTSNDGYAVSEQGNDVILIGDDVSLAWYNPNVLRSGESLFYQVPLREQGWTHLNSAVPADRSDFMTVLKNLRRVLVKATLADRTLMTSIADVSMDIATEQYTLNAQTATGIEICTCPPGHLGTSCETCAAGYYKNEQDYCTVCPCNGHDCQMDTNQQVVCNCRPPYTGRNCSTYGNGQPQVTTNRPPMPQSTVTVRITSPSITIHEVGSSVNFTCQAQSPYTQRLVMSWSKVDGYLPQGRAFIDQYSGVLRITNLQITDSGQYICQTSDGRSTGQASVTLKVPANQMVLPSVEIRPPIKEYYAGDRIELECIASGSPQPTISWQRASRRPLPSSSEHFEELFIIESAREEDSGEYRCIASNTVGSADRTAVINVRPRPARPLRDKLVVKPTSATINEGQSTRLVCTGSTNVPAGTIDWVRQDGDRFQANVRSDNGVLYIDVATVINAGVYVCQTHGADVEPESVLLTVVSTATLSPNQAPEVTVPLKTLTIPSGGSGKVDCFPRGQPLPLIRWSKYQNELGRGVSQRGDSLIINEAEESDAGYYVCEGLDRRDSNVLTSVFVYIDIEKRERPVVQIWPQGEQPVALGNTEFEFQCRVLFGIPKPEVTWSRAGGRALSSHAEIKPNNILKFDKIEVNDEGEYICTGDNSVGSASASAVIKVRSPPEIVITPANYLTVNTGEPVNIECRAEGYPEPKVTIRGPDQTEIISQFRIAQLRITAAEARDEGDYSCVATNQAGTMEEAFALRVERGDGGYDDAGSGDDEIYPNQPDPVYPYPNPNENQVYNPNPYPEEPQNPIRPAERTAFEGQKELTIYCNVTNGYNPTWDRGDRQPLQYNAQQVENRLIIRNVSKSDSGQYVCSAYNYATNDVQVALYTTLRVVSVPKITLRPPTQTVHPGYSPTVECVVQGDDIVDIVWRPTYKPFSSRVRVRNATLIFQQIEVEDAGKYECIARNQWANASATAEVIVVGAPEEPMVRIEQPRRAFRVGENVDVLCKSASRDIAVEWIKRDQQGNRQHVDSHTYGGGSLLRIIGVAEQDAGTYQCIGRNRFGQNYTDNFNLDIVPGSAISNPRDRSGELREYSAALRSAVSMPCIHDLEEPVTIQWRREYAALPNDARSNQPILHLRSVTEGDAGTYVCRVSNRRTTVETKAILRVVGVIPRFDGGSWVALPALKDAYRQFDIEISFKPTDGNGLILYNSQNAGRDTDFLALQLKNGVPTFILETGSGPVVVTGDRPLELNRWHSIRLNKIDTKVTMDVDNDGPFVVDTAENWVLELNQPLYIGGVPDYQQLPSYIEGATGFAGCVSMLVLGQSEKNIMMELLDQERVATCDTCAGNLCKNGSICQESRNERGYICICDKEFAGPNCDRRGEACRPGLCGVGKCSNTDYGYKCACPVTHTGRNCETRQQIEYPAFTGSAYLALKPPSTFRYLKMSMKVKASAPVTDGIIMYCAESPRGHGGFTSLAVKNGRLEFRYDLGDGNPAILTSNSTLSANDWTDVQVARSGHTVSLNINLVQNYEARLESTKSLKLETPLFVGGVDENIVLNSNTGVSGGFMGCIKDLKTFGTSVHIDDPNVQSSNVQECSSFPDRGDIPEIDNNPCRCNNGGSCAADGSCICPPGFSGYYCESRLASSLRYPSRAPSDPCDARPCQNGGTCRTNYVNRMNHTCDCPMGFAGASCQMHLSLYSSVGFNGNGYLELPANLVRYGNLEREPAVIALRASTVQDGVLAYQGEVAAAPDTGDYLLIRIENGHVVLEWDMGSGITSLSVNSDDGKSGFVADGEMHQIVVRLLSEGRVELTVDGITENAITNGLANSLNVDSNIYIGGIPERLNLNGYSGLIGCIDQVEFMDTGHGVSLGTTAVTGRNTQMCKNY